MSTAIPLARLRVALTRRASFLGAVALVLLSCAGVARAERLKDIAALAGVRNNHMIGYGLVVGLDETGDQTTQAPFT